MTVTTNTSRISYTGDGASTVFAVPFIFLNNADIDVYVDGIQVTTGFATTGAGSGTGNVTFTTAPAVDAIVLLVRNPDFLQNTDIPSNGPFPSSAVEALGDKAMIAIQRLSDLQGRSLTLDDGDSLSDPLVLPSTESRSSRLLAFDAAGLPAAPPFTTDQVASAVAAAYLGGAATTLDAVAFVQSGTGAVSRSAQRKMREQPSTPYDCGAVGDGTTDDTAKVQAWAANGVKNKSWGSGRFLIKAEIVFEADAQVTGNGEESVVVIDPAFVGSYPIQNTPGTLTLITGPSAAMTRGDSSLTFAAAPALAADDVFILYNPTDSSWSGFRTYYREGEFCEVASVVGSVVGLKNALYDSYVAAAMSCYKMSPDRSCFENFVIEGATSLGLIKVSLGMNNRVKVRATNANDSCVQFDRCIYPSIGDGTDLYNAGGGANDYALVFSNCQHGRTPDSFHAYARRHAVTCGGTDVVGAVPCRDVLVRGVLKNDINSGVPSANFHGNCDDCHFLDITARAVNLAGRNTSVRGGKLTHVLNGTIAAIGEVKGGLIGLFGVRLSTTVNPQPSPTSQGIIDFGGNSNAVTASTDEDLDIQVHGCKLRGRNLSSLTSVLIFANRGSAARVNFSVQDLALDVDALGFILHTQLVSGTAASASCIVDGISGAPAGCALAAHVASGYETFPQRMQRQAGILAGVTTATTSVIAAPITLPMSYPKVPTATAGVRGVGGAALGTLGGQADVSARSFQATATTARPMIAAPAAFTASAAFEFTWATELREC